MKVRKKVISLDSSKQDLDLYWNEEFANQLENWGEDNAWNEIQLLLCNCNGKFLDIACGTGRTIEILSRYPQLDIYGFDISDVLLQRAEKRGISMNKLQRMDATKTNYENSSFDYSYSIGSLEHFTEIGINDFLKESARYTRVGSFHMIPVSRNNKNEGWIKTTQSYFNNSEEWWLEKFKSHFSKVYIINSKWEDRLSYGRWFICYK
jgi:ubiquinone/menaquinone biosynthesis C-methylase UbiE